MGNPEGFRTRRVREQHFHQQWRHHRQQRGGYILTVIDNPSAAPIGGTFANVSDGSTLTVGVNKVQMSYSGGDGNDLTLTVIQ